MYNVHVHVHVLWTVVESSSQDSASCNMVKVVKTCCVLPKITHATCTVQYEPFTVYVTNVKGSLL